MYNTLHFLISDFINICIKSRCCRKSDLWNQKQKTNANTVKEKRFRMKSSQTWGIKRPAYKFPVDWSLSSLVARPRRSRMVPWARALLPDLELRLKTLSIPILGTSWAKKEAKTFFSMGYAVMIASDYAKHFGDRIKHLPSSHAEEKRQYCQLKGGKQSPTEILMSVHPRKSSTLSAALFLADCAICLKYLHKKHRTTIHPPYNWSIMPWNRKLFTDKIQSRSPTDHRRKGINQAKKPWMEWAWFDHCRSSLRSLSFIPTIIVVHPYDHCRLRDDSYRFSPLMPWTFFIFFTASSTCRMKIEFEMNISAICVLRGDRHIT